MPSRLNSYSIKPPGGYQYRVPETGAVIKSGSMPELMRAIAKHCVAMDIGVPSNETVEDQMCVRMGKSMEQYCVDVKSGQQSLYPPGRPDCGSLTVASVIDATKILFRTKLSGPVSGAMAEKRAAICSKCEWNQDVAGCKGCSSPALRAVAESIVGGSTTTHHDDLNTCCLCGCWLRAKVWIPKEILKDYPKPIEEVKKWAPHCWLLQDEL